MFKRKQRPAPNRTTFDHYPKLSERLTAYGVPDDPTPAQLLRLVADAFKREGLWAGARKLDSAADRLERGSAA